MSSASGSSCNIGSEGFGNNLNFYYTMKDVESVDTQSGYMSGVEVVDQIDRERPGTKLPGEETEKFLTKERLQIIRDIVETICGLALWSVVLSPIGMVIAGAVIGSSALWIAGFSIIMVGIVVIVLLVENGVRNQDACKKCEMNMQSMEKREGQPF